MAKMVTLHDNIQPEERIKALANFKALAGVAFLFVVSELALYLEMFR